MFSSFFVSVEVVFFTLKKEAITSASFFAKVFKLLSFKAKPIPNSSIVFSSSLRLLIRYSLALLPKELFKLLINNLLASSTKS